MALVNLVLFGALFLTGGDTADGFVVPTKTVRKTTSLATVSGEIEDAAFQNNAEAQQQQAPKQQMDFFDIGSLDRREAVAASATLLLGPLSIQHVMESSGNTISSLSTETLAALEKGDEIIRSLWLGRLAYPTLTVALESGLFEALKSDKLTKQELGKRLDPPLPGSSHAIEAFTMVLSSLGLLNIDDKGMVSLTEPAKLSLLKDSKYFWGPQLLCADGLTASLRRAVKLESLDAPATAKTAFQDHSQASTDSFIKSMQAHSGTTAEMTAVALEPVLGPSSPNPASHILDMAGGSGCFSCALARKIPSLRVTLSDLPSVVALWRRENGVSGGLLTSKKNRIDSTPADLFDVHTWPRGADTVLLANVIHDWSDEKSCQIMAAARSVLQDRNNRNTSKGRLILIEQLVHDNLTGPLPGSLASVSMLLGDWRSGKQYSFAALKEMMHSVGFDHVELGPKCGNFHYAVIATLGD